WTDPKKLSIQVAILETNPKAVLCSHRYRVVTDLGNVKSDDGLDSVFGPRPELVTTFQNFLDPYLLKTLTVVFRRSALAGFYEKRNDFDAMLWAHLLSKGGHGIALSRVMGIYRKHEKGICSNLTPPLRAEFEFEQLTSIATN